MVCLRIDWLLLMGAVAFPLTPRICAQENASPPAVPALAVDDFAGEVRSKLRSAYADVKREPGSAEASGRIGMILFAHEQLELAVPWFTRAVVLAKDDARWHYYLGTVLSDLSRHGEAIPELRESVRLDPHDLPARHNLADALLGAGELVEAAAVYNEIVRKYPLVASAHYGLGRVETARHNPGRAKEHYMRACELYPEFGAAHYALALTYRELGDVARAREHLRYYEKNRLGSPTLPDPRLGEIASLGSGAFPFLKRGIQAEAAGDLKTAVLEHERAVEVDPAYIQAHLNLIMLYGKLGQADAAERHYRAALKLNPNIAEGHFNYGVLMTGLGKDQDAAQAFRRTLEINPYHAEAYSNLAFILMTEGKLEEAADLYRKALQNKPSHRVAHFNLGRILVNQRKLPEAIEHLLQTLTPDDENTPGYLYALGAVYAHNGDRASALRYIRDARSKAEALGQKDLLVSIDRDLNLLERRTATTP